MNSIILWYVCGKGRRQAFSSSLLTIRRPYRGISSPPRKKIFPERSAKKYFLHNSKKIFPPSAISTLILPPPSILPPPPRSPATDSKNISCDTKTSTNATVKSLTEKGSPYPPSGTPLRPHHHLSHLCSRKAETGVNNNKRSVKWLKCRGMPRYFPKLFQKFKKSKWKISKSLGKYLGIPRHQHQNTPRIPQIPFKSTFYSIFLFLLLSPPSQRSLHPTQSKDKSLLPHRRC